MSESDNSADANGDIWSPDRPPDPGAVDAPEADAVEQRQDVVDHEPDQPQSVPDDVNPADAVEQRRAVGYDDDDYR
ncbi:MAG: hypothetical protein ACRDZV_11900 [Acidimicrobiia bacterium]